MLRLRSTFPLAATVALFTIVAPPQSFSGFQAVAAGAAFEVPVAVSGDTSLKVSSGSDAMAVISEALKTSFEGKFNGAEVNIDAVGAEQAIQALLNGDADLAAISRPLSAAETAQGLSAVDVKRVKIAIIVGAENPFNGSLTGEQFAKIFRGEIKNWSEVGGPSAPIRLVDRPETSDTRLALAPYPVFQSAKFATGKTATQLVSDSPADVAKALGNDGISYVLVDEVGALSGVRTLSMHKTLPTDARYPFSQPFSLVYSGEPSPAVAAFLGYAAGAPGQSALQSVNPLAGVVSAAGNTVKGAADAAGDAVQGAAGAAGDVVEGAAGAAGDAVEGAADGAGDVANQVTAAADQAVSDVNPQSKSRANLWWLLIVPAAFLGLWAWGARRRKDERVVTSTNESTTEGIDLSGVGKAGAGVAAGAAAVGGAAWATAKQGGNVAKDGLGNVGNVAKDGLDNVGNMAKGGLGNVGDVAKDGLGGIKGGLDNVGDVAKGGLGNLQTGLGNVGNVAKGGLGNVGDMAKGGLGNVGDAAKGGLGGIKGGLDNVGDAVKGGLGNLQTGLDNFGDAAKGGLDNLKGTAQQGVDGVAGGLGNVGNVAKGGLDNLQGGLGNVGDAAKGGIDKLQGGLGNVGDAAKGGLGNLASAAQQGVDGVAGGLGNAGNAVQGGANTVTGKLGGMVDDAGNAMKKVADAAEGTPQSLWQRVRDGANQAADQAGKLKDKAADVVDDLKDRGN
ncbi:substrate-binding domain-containing protein [Leptothoe sp. PORK10 BA2]|uniref:substrate-binding domain-containing protein n=1 Tax=Leptothoe sp. PORK10 BA2 TaxID=3110254 RepID=UPI002B1FAF93|nr:substrate-binding domain-containing protein [Leptothoe sp. PORK10 BA2]MEA5465485.1 substrate-binding domain-containing protein [Leptothoe sp. PORK10 BA2]